MKFVVSSNLLLTHLQAISRVISSKNTLPILDNFLFELSDKKLQITASDLESTMITQVALDNTSDKGNIAIPAKILLEILKEFSDQPLTFDINTNTLGIVIHSTTGKFTIMGQNGGDFPQLPNIKKDKKSGVQLKTDILLTGIHKTLFATADDELRPVMNGIFVEMGTDDITFVASDAHKLVRYKRSDVKPGVASAFILPKKPAGLLKNILVRGDHEVMMEFDDKNASFTMPGFQLICRLVEGSYPNYNAVIPPNNPNKLMVDRVEFYNSLRRVSLFASQASSLVKLSLTGNKVVISAQDIDFSISANETLSCTYEGDEMEIGFKATFFLEILSNLASQDVVVEMSDPTRAGLILPLQKDIESEDVLMLLMPMMIGS
ncbi:MAG: DNA polymerase III subunit beta [Bacteroidales bacterium]